MSHLKNAFRRLFEYPLLGVVVRDDFHRDAEIAIADEYVDGLADA